MARGRQAMPRHRPPSSHRFRPGSAGNLSGGTASGICRKERCRFQPMDAEYLQARSMPAPCHCSLTRQEPVERATLRGLRAIPGRPLCPRSNAVRRDQDRTSCAKHPREWRNGEGRCPRHLEKRCSRQANRWPRISRRAFGHSWKTSDRPLWATKGSTEPKREDCNPRDLSNVPAAGHRDRSEARRLPSAANCRASRQTGSSQRRRRPPKIKRGPRRHLVIKPLLRRIRRRRFGVNSELMRLGRRHNPPRHPPTLPKTGRKDAETRT